MSKNTKRSWPSCRLATRSSVCVCVCVCVCVNSLCVCAQYEGNSRTNPNIANKELHRQRPQYLKYNKL